MPLNKTPSILNYSQLGRPSWLRVQVDELGLRVSCPGRPFWHISILVAGVTLLLLVATAVLAFWMIDGYQYWVWYHKLFIYLLKPLFLILALAAFWWSVILIARQLFRRRRMPTDLIVADGKLILLNPESDPMRREFSTGQIVAISARPVGVGFRLQSVGELRIQCADGKRVNCFRGFDFDELEWAATIINDHLNCPVSGSDRISD